MVCNKIVWTLRICVVIITGLKLVANLMFASFSRYTSVDS